MFSMSMQCGVKGSLTCLLLSSQRPCFMPLKTSAILKPRAASKHSLTLLNIKSRAIRRIQELEASATGEAATADSPAETSDESEPATTQESVPGQETVKVETATGKKVDKPRLLLKFIWLEKNIGLGLDQIIPGHGSVPLSPYFFWPRKDAWEELKATLESKPWISQKKMIILLNQATDIINLWQQSGGDLSS